jgi:hypothetical protein
MLCTGRLCLHLGGEDREMDDFGQGRWLRVPVRELRSGLQVCLLLVLEWKRRKQIRGAPVRMGLRFGLALYLQVTGDESQKQRRVRRLARQLRDRLACALRGGLGSWASLGMGARCGRSSTHLLRQFDDEARVEIVVPLLGIGLIERWELGSGIASVHVRSAIFLSLCLGLMYLGNPPSVQVLAYLEDTRSTALT